MAVQDTFVRSSTAGNTAIANVAGWGAASDGNTWTADLGTGAPTWSISSANTGKITGTAVNTYTQLSATTFTDVDVSAAVQTGTTSTVHRLGIVARYGGVSSGYIAYIIPGLAGAGSFIIAKCNGASAPTVLATQASQTFAAATRYFIRIQCIGTTIQARYWLASGAEPGTWNVTTTDATFSSGQTGCYFAPATTAAIFQVDTFVGTSLGVALTATMAGAGTLSGTVALSTSLSDTLAATGQVIPTLSAAKTLNGTTLVGLSTLSNSLTLSTSLSCTFSCVGTGAAALSISGTTPLILYGSNVAATGISGAGQCATALGGAETSVITTAPPSGDGYVECFALGGVSPAATASLPPPSGKGWMLDLPTLEEQRLNGGNWTASVPVSDATNGGIVTSYTIRFWQHAVVGTYALLGSIALTGGQTISVTRAVKSFPATLMPQTDFTYGDRLYIDFFINATGWLSDQLSVYVSNSVLVGVAGDFEVDTAGFLPSGDAGVVTSYIPRAFSALLIVTSTALSTTIAGGTTLSGTVTQATRLSDTIICVGTLIETLTCSFSLSSLTYAGVATLTGNTTLLTTLTASLSGVSTLTGIFVETYALVCIETGSSSTSLSAFQLATALSDTLSTSGVLIPTLLATCSMSAVSFITNGTVSPVFSASTPFLSTCSGVAIFSGALQSSAGAVLSCTISVSGSNTAALSAAFSLSAIAYTGVSIFTPLLSVSFTLAGRTTDGLTTLTGTFTLSTHLAATSVAVGSITGILAATLSLSPIIYTGIAVFTGIMIAPINGTVSGTSSINGTLSFAYVLTDSFSGTSSVNSGFAFSCALVTSLGGTSGIGANISSVTAITANTPGLTTSFGTITFSTALSTPLSASATLNGTLSTNSGLSGVLSGSSGIVAVASAACAFTLTSMGNSQVTPTVSASIGVTVTCSGGSSSSVTPFYQMFYAVSLQGSSTQAATIHFTTSFLVTSAGASTLSGQTTCTLNLFMLYTGRSQMLPALYIQGFIVTVFFVGTGVCTGTLSFPGKSETATWKTRDYTSVWGSRDYHGRWKTRDDHDSWEN